MGEYGCMSSVICLLSRDGAEGVVMNATRRGVGVVGEATPLSCVCALGSYVDVRFKVVFCVLFSCRAKVA